MLELLQLLRNYLPLLAGNGDVSGDGEWVAVRRHRSRPHKSCMKEKLYKNIGVFQKVTDPRALFRPGEGLTAFLPSRVVTGPRPVQGASFSCSGPAQQSAAGAPFDPDVLRLWLVQAHEILSQQSQVSFGQADGRHSLSDHGHASDHSVSRDVRGKSCAVGKCSHVCEAGGKAPCDGLLVPLPPKSRGLQLHHDADRIRRRVALGTNGRLSPSACVPRPGHSAEFGERAAGADDPDAAVRTAAAGDSERIIRLHEVSESDFPPLLRSSQSPNSCPGSWSSACARSVARRVAAAPARVCPGSSSSAVSAAVAHAHASVLHGASVNSWSDMVRLHGPTGTRRVKGGVSRPAEDLRPVSEVEAGVNFRPAGRVRGQVAGSLPGKQPGAGSRPNKGSVHLPSTRRFLILCLCRLDQARESGN